MSVSRETSDARQWRQADELAIQMTEQKGLVWRQLNQTQRTDLTTKAYNLIAAGSVPA